MTRDEALERAVDILGEHFDAVQVMASFSEGGATHGKQRGVGNWYARQGMAHDFIKSDDAIENANALAKVIHPEDD